MKKIPTIITSVGFDFDWDEEKVWKLTLPIERIPIKELSWHFEIPFWHSENGHYDLNPQAVLDHPQTYTKEFERMMKSDLSYPLDIMFWRGKWLLLDGLHRLLKAQYLGHDTVSVRKVPTDIIPKIRR